MVSVDGLSKGLGRGWEMVGVGGQLRGEDSAF